MNRVNDIGGLEGWGRAHPPSENEPVFPEAWNGRAFALTLLSMQVAGFNLDAFRHAIDRLSEEDYFKEGYFGRWLNSAELMLTDSAVLARGAVSARARNLRGEAVAEPPVPTPVSRHPEPSASGSLRPIDEVPAFAAGERVRAKRTAPTDATRLVSYVRGKTGTVSRIQPSAVLPDSNAYFRGENPQHVYTVDFDSRTLWGPGADCFVLTVELYEYYLEKIS